MDTLAALGQLMSSGLDLGLDLDVRYRHGNDAGQ